MTTMMKRRKLNIVAGEEDADMVEVCFCSVFEVEQNFRRKRKRTTMGNSASKGEDDENFVILSGITGKKKKSLIEIEVPVDAVSFTVSITTKRRSFFLQLQNK